MAAISVDGVIAADFTHDSMNADFFYEFARVSLIPKLLPKSKVSSHNGQLFHHVDFVEQLFHNAGILLLFLLPYSPDINPRAYF